jgi:phasin family protein
LLDLPPAKPNSGFIPMMDWYKKQENMMAEKTSSTANAYTNQFFNSDFLKGFTPVNGMFPFDMGAVMETHRKNIEALTEAQQIAMQNLQSIAQFQSEMMTQIVADNTTLARQILTEGTPEEKVSRQADMVKQSYERSVSTMTELSEMVTKSNREAGEIISKRVTSSLTEFKAGLEDGAKKVKEKVKAAA